MRQPRYMVYVPSKGRSVSSRHTADLFEQEGVPHRVVVEPQEFDAYAERFGETRLLALPENDRGLIYSRNWIKDHSCELGEVRHWQFDDDIWCLSRVHRGFRIRCSANVALVVLEDFVERYENVVLASFNSEFFLPVTAGFAREDWPPFYLNARCYTAFLMLNSLPNRWRYRYNEDTDMTLQVLADGWCTILLNAFAIKTPRTMTDSGGQTSIYTEDGRLRMSRQLERVWPHVVETKRRFGRPQHYVKGQWTKFDTPLQRKPGIDPSKMEPNEYGLELEDVATVQSTQLKGLLEDERHRRRKGT